MAKKKPISNPTNKLNSDEEFKGIIVESNPQNIFPEDLNIHVNEIITTGTYLGGTINTLGHKVESIQQMLVRPYDSVNFSLIQNELATIKTEILPQLEESKKTLKSVETFMRDNALFLTNLVGAEGKLRGFEGELLSISRRLEKIESEKNIAWNKTTTIISILIAIISAGFAVYFGLIK